MKAVIVYDDGSAGARAYTLLERAARAASRTVGTGLWSVWLWQIGQLDVPSTADAALDRALGAHLVMVALNHQRPSPAGLSGWLESWAGLREHRDAAFAVCESEEGHLLSATLAREMTAFAQRHGLSLILGGVERGDAVPPGGERTQGVGWV